MLLFGAKLGSVDGIIEFDKSLFQKINGEWANPFLDQLMPVLTDLHEHLWFVAILIPVLVAFWVFKFKKTAAKALVLMALSIALADAISYRIIKPIVDRERPQQSGIPVTLRTHPHSGKSFPSNHAANNFAAATILSFVHPAMGPIFFAIATVVAYSRIYVGVHFPLDVMGGALLGMIISFTIWTTFGFRWINKNGRLVLPPDPLRKVQPRYTGKDPKSQK